MAGFLEEHRRLHGYLEAVEAALSASAPEAAVSGLVSTLGQLGPALQAHFAREEEEGLFDGIQEAWPHAARACDRLRGEHPVLLARLERLQAEGKAGSVSEGALSTLLDGVRSFLKDLGRHEALENELMTGSLDDSVAAQD
jgi:iron-sulfur cluster repair protein YtfE (RIC family)